MRWIALLLFPLLALVSCSKEEEETTQLPNGEYEGAFHREQRLRADLGSLFTFFDLAQQDALLVFNTFGDRPGLNTD